MNLINSSQNPKIKKIKRYLDKISQQKKDNIFLVSGEREIKKAKKNNFAIDSVFITKETKKKLISDLEIDNEKINIIEKNLLTKISPSKNPSQILGICQRKKNNFSIENKNQKEIILVLDNLEKPGNIGAILRTALGFGVKNIIINGDNTDIYHHNIIRASLGSIFFMNISCLSYKETYQTLKENNIDIYATFLDKKSKSITELKKSKKNIALILGSEDKGINKLWQEKSNELIFLPMKKEIDSLNVSVSAGILLWIFFSK